MTHCWMSGPPEKDGMSTTCMKPYNHPGEHEFIRDCDISFRIYRDWSGSEEDESEIP